MKRMFALAAAMIGLAGPRALGGMDGEVKAISVLPAPGRADVLIGVRGSVDVRDFTLDGPPRVVIDVVGARLAAGTGVYDGENRGGVVNIRSAQYQPDIVRIVVELDALRNYRIERRADGILLSLSTERDFEAWSSEMAAALAPAAPAARVSEPPRVPRRLTNFRHLVQQGARINAAWDSADVIDVIAAFAAYANRTIIPGKGVSGLVRGVEVRNQPWDAAFSAFLDAYDLAAVELPTGIIRVDSRAEIAARDSIQPLETRVVAINYVKAASLRGTVEAVVTPNRGRVVADTATNSLVITDVVGRIDDIVDFVTGLDVRTPQVSIQGKLIFVDRRNVEDLGVRYDLGSRNQFSNKLVQRIDPATGDAFPSNTNIIDLGGSALSALGNADAELLSPALELIYSTALGNFDITTFVVALQRIELADVQAEPISTVLSNRLASVLVGDKIPLRVIDPGATVSGGAAGADVPRATIRFEETGIRLEVTPHVTATRQVLMDIHAERSSVLPAPVDIGFTVQTQEATTQVLVSDGETAVIGGLTVTEVTVTRTGIPLLMELPIVGRLFSFSSEAENRRDLLILVTPHIIDDLPPVGGN